MSQEIETLQSENEALRRYVRELEIAVATPDLVDAIAYSSGKHLSVKTPKKGTDFVSRQDQARTTVVECFAETVRATWENACRHDNIELSSPFVVFSPDNPVAPFVSPAQKQLLEAVAMGNALGYVMQEIKDGKVVDAVPLKRPKAKKLPRNK